MSLAAVSRAEGSLAEPRVVKLVHLVLLNTVEGSTKWLINFKTYSYVSGIRFKTRIMLRAPLRTGGIFRQRVHKWNAIRVEQIV